MCQRSTLLEGWEGGGGRGRGEGGGGGRDIKGNTGFINSSFKRSVSFQTWAELFEAGLR